MRGRKVVRGTRGVAERRVWVQEEEESVASRHSDLGAYREPCALDTQKGVGM